MYVCGVVPLALNLDGRFRYYGNAPAYVCMYVCVKVIKVCIYSMFVCMYGIYKYVCMYVCMYVWK